MLSNTSFTAHAYDRVLDGLSLGPGDLADLLDHGRAVDVGTEPQTNRVHRLFYSPADERCFVAVQDIGNGDIVMLMDTSQHEAGAWKIEPAALDRARALLEGPGRMPVPVPDVEGWRYPERRPAIFRLVAYQRCPGGRIKAISLGKWPTAPYDHRIERLLQDDRFFTELNARVAGKQLDPAALDAVFVAVGNRGRSIRISLRTPVASTLAGA